MDNGRLAGCCSNCRERCFLPKEQDIIKLFKVVKFHLLPEGIGSFVLCKECLSKDLNFEAMEQFMREGWEEELSEMGRTEEEKQQYRDTFFGYKIQEKL